MKKRILVILASLLIAVMIATPVFAGDGVGVDLSDIVVEGGNTVGDEVTASGTVTISAEAAYNSPWYYYTTDHAFAESYATCTVENPEGTQVGGDTGYVSDYDEALWYQGGAEVDASQVFPWEIVFTLEDPGEYVITHGGTAFAEWWCYWHSGDDYDEDFASFVWEAKPRPGKPAATGPSWMPVQNMFSLWFGGIHSYNWIDGNTLPAIDQVSSGHWNGAPYTMRVVIPEGTEVYGGYCLRLCYEDGGLTFHSLSGGTMTFSNPVAIYTLVDGEWVQTGNLTMF